MNTPKTNGPASFIKRRRVVRRYKAPPRVPWGAFTRPDHGNLTVVVHNEHSKHWPTVFITADAHGKMRALIDACKIEVSWLSTCTQAENGDVVIDDVFVPSQVCTAGSTFINPDGENELLTELLAQKRKDEVSKLHCWGHSHVRGGVYASGVDEEQTSDFLRRAREMRKKKFFVRLIANKYDDLFASIYFLDDAYELDYTLHHVPIIAEPPATEVHRKWARKQVRVKVKKAVIIPQNIPPELMLEEYGDYPNWYLNFLSMPNSVSAEANATTQVQMPATSGKKVVKS